MFWAHLVARQGEESRTILPRQQPVHQRIQLHICHLEEPSIWGVPWNTVARTVAVCGPSPARVAACAWLCAPAATFLMFDQSLCSCKRPGCMWQGLATLVLIRVLTYAARLGQLAQHLVLLRCSWAQPGNDNDAETGSQGAPTGTTAGLSKSSQLAVLTSGRWGCSPATDGKLSLQILLFLPCHEAARDPAIISSGSVWRQGRAIMSCLCVTVHGARSGVKPAETTPHINV